MSSPVDVIMRLNPLTARIDPDRTIVYLDTKSREAVNATNFGVKDKVRWGMREKLRYDVWPDRSVILDNLQEPISNFFTKETLSIDYRMRVWIEGKHAVRAVETLYRPDKPPETVLRQHIGEFLTGKLEAQSRQSGEAMAKHFIDNAKAWEVELVAGLMQKFGVSAQVLMDSLAEIEPTMKVSFGPLDVRPQDAPRTTGLSLLGDLVLSQRGGVHADAAG